MELTETHKPRVRELLAAVSGILRRQLLEFLNLHPKLCFEQAIVIMTDDELNGKDLAEAHVRFVTQSMPGNTFLQYQLLQNFLMRDAPMKILFPGVQDGSVFNAVANEWKEKLNKK